MPGPIDDSVQTSFYKDYHNDSTYTRNPGRLVIPCANGDPVVVQVHRPYSVRTQTWSAVKEYTPPVLPAPDVETGSGANSTLIAMTVSIPMAQPMGGGTPNTFRFAAAGTYQYLETSPSTPSTGYTAGLSPYINTGLLTALAGVGGGAAFALPFVLSIPFATGNYTWPFAAIGPQFFDPSLSYTRSAGGYAKDDLGRA